MAILIIRKRYQKDMMIHDISHAEASKLMRGMFAGERCKIIDKQQRSFPKTMRSYTDMMYAEQ
jgi:hypothetical protein